MDKTTTWLVRAASLIVILFGIGYLSKPVGNKINDLSSSFKDFKSKPNLKGIACSFTKEDLNKSDDFLVRESTNEFFKIIFDNKNGDYYYYDAKTNYVYNYLDFYFLYLKENVLLRDYPVAKFYKSDSFFYIDSVSYLENGEEASKEPKYKINLKTLDWYEFANNSYSLLGTCRNFKIPKNIKLIEAEEYFNKVFYSE